MKNFWAIGSVIVLVLLGFFLLRDRQPKTPTNDTVKIGVINFLTGDQAAIGEEVQNALLLANDERASSADKKLELLFEDSHDDPKTAIGIYNKLKDEGVKTIIATGDQVSYALSPLANKDKLPLLITVAAATETSGEYTFRGFITAAQQATLMADYSSRILGYKRLGLLYINNIFGDAYLKSLTTAFSTTNQTLVSNEAFGIVDSDVKTQIAKVLASKPDSIIIAGFGPGYTVAFNQLRQLGWKGSILSVNTLAIPYFFNSIPAENLHDTYFTDTGFDTTNPANPKAADFIKNYREKFNADPSFVAAFTYDLHGILISAIRDCGNDSEAIRTCLLHTTSTVGVLGTIDFSTQEMKVPLYIKKVMDGKVVNAEEVR